MHEYPSAFGQRALKVKQNKAAHLLFPVFPRAEQRTRLCPSVCFPELRTSREIADRIARAAYVEVI